MVRERCSGVRLSATVGAGRQAGIRHESHSRYMLGIEVTAELRRYLKQAIDAALRQRID
jgi:hypothetical protein